MIDFGREVENILEEYGKNVNNVLSEAVEEAGSEGVRLLKALSPKRRGAYAKSWVKKSIPNARGVTSVVVHNAKHYRLTHVLEYGHVKRGGGRVKAQPHISKAEETLQERLPEIFEERL